MTINFEEFQKVELKVATVKAASRVEGSEKLLKLTVDLGTQDRQILAGIGKKYEPEELVGRQIVIVANLEPRSLMGLESQGMVLAATDQEGKPVVISPAGEVAPGTSLK